MTLSRRALVVLFAALVALATFGGLLRSRKGSTTVTSAPAKRSLCEKEGKPYSEGSLVKAPDGKGILTCREGQWVENK